MSVRYLRFTVHGWFSACEGIEEFRVRDLRFGAFRFRASDLGFLLCLRFTAFSAYSKVKKDLVGTV